MTQTISMQTALILAAIVGAAVYFFMSSQTKKTTTTTTPQILPPPQQDPLESTMKWLTFLNELKSPPKKEEISDLDKFGQIADLMKKMQKEEVADTNLSGVKDVIVTFKPATMETKKE